VGTDASYQHFCQIPCNLNPGNISFKVQNLLEEWPAEDKEAYDLVHQRYCLALFTPAQDQEIIERLWELVKPGGYIQYVES
jgi:chemotaxis methyl-accepting protein methylase